MKQADGDGGGGQAGKSPYWRDNLRLVGICLAVWFLASFGCGILFADALNRISIGGFALGFWFAQQGAMLVFLALIAVYARVMLAIERRHGVGEDDS